MRKFSCDRWATLAAGALLATASHCAFAAVTGALADTVADWMSVFILLVMPPAAIYLFWILHILPEKAAKRRNHPQKDAIHMLCLLSLVFGGLLWPLAWLWAFTRPVAYKMAYGTDKHEDWHEEMGEKAKAGELLHEELAHLRGELDAMAARGALPANLKQLRADLEQLQAMPAGIPPAPGGRA